MLLHLAPSPSFDGCHWMAIQSSPLRDPDLPMQLGEKEVRFHSILHLILPLAAALSHSDFLVPAFHFFNYKIPIIT